MPKNTPSIKILVCYHKPAHIFENEILTPIHLGRAVAKKASWAGTVLGGMPGDDTGKNISVLNPKFCEMTGLYWAWRNYDALGNPDYFGLMHYRRLLDFIGEHPSGVLHVDSPEEVRLESINPQAIRGVVARHDLCVKAPVQIEWRDPQGNPGLCNVLQQYLVAHENRYLLDAFSTAAGKWPDYAPDLAAYSGSTMHYLCNIAVMRREVFFDYAEWMFSILFDMEKLIDYAAPRRDIRVISYLSERLTGLYMTRLHRLGKLRIKHLTGININCY